MVLVEHHTKYKEIHGVDETIWLEESDHRKLHIRLRKERKCNVPAKELRKISAKASRRTEKAKSQRARDSKRRRDARHRSDNKKEVHSKNHTIMFQSNIRLTERIFYKLYTDRIRIAQTAYVSASKHYIHLLSISL